MHNPWDRPSGSAAPQRSLDKYAEPIFTALGRAVSAWEGVQAATTELYLSLLDHNNDEEDEKVLDEFGEILRVPHRAKAIRDRFDVLCAKADSVGEDFETAFRSEIKTLLKSYEGWTQRRNDLAHGYVTEWEAPDYSDDEQPIVTFFGLLPSHARTRKWFNYEPEYNYIAAEIENFADEFRKLDGDLAALAQRMNAKRETDLTS